MDTWQCLVALIALVAVGKWYAWAQMRYWCGRECQEDPERRKASDEEGAGHA